MKRRLDWAWTVVLLALLAYGLYASFTEAWPMGWINLAQQSVFGSYSVKVSFLIFVVVALALAAGLWSVIERAAARRFASSGQGSDAGVASFGVPKKTPSSARTLTQSQLLLRVGAGTIVVLWLGGFVAFAWFSQEQRADNDAEYRPLRLDDSTTVVVAEGDHLAVLGVVLANRTVVHRTGSSDQEDYWLLPLVPSSWRAGQAAQLVVKVNSPWQLHGYAPDAPEWVLPQPLLVRVGAALPVTATSRFDKIGVPLATDHHVLHVIASLDGKPLRQDTDYLEITLWVCGVGSALLLLMFSLSAWIVHRREG